MCCVIPPASPATTEEFLNWSSKVVLPWSTCPMIVTTGGRTACESLSAAASSKYTSKSEISFSIFSSASIP